MDESICNEWKKCATGVVEQRECREAAHLSIFMRSHDVANLFMPISPRTLRPAVSIAIMALSATTRFALADTTATNDGMRFVSAGVQADSQHNQEALSTISLPVGQHAWVQAGGGKSHGDQVAGGTRPTIVTGAAGVAGKALQFTVNASRRADGSRYRQTDWGSSLEWRHGGGNVGLDVTHRRSQTTGTAAAPGALVGVPAQVKLAGTGVGMHGSLPVSERVSVYASVARTHYTSGTRATDPSSTNVLLGGASLVNRDEVALNRSAQAGATWRGDRVAISGEYTVGQVYGDGGALRSVDVKAAIDVAPGWRVAPGVGRGTSGQGGHANFASLAASYGW